MGQVVNLPDRQIGEGVTLDPDNVLESAKGHMRECVVLGVAKDGSWFLASSHGERHTIALIEIAKDALLTQGRRARGWD